MWELTEFAEETCLIINQLIKRSGGKYLLPNEIIMELTVNGWIGINDRKEMFFQEGLFAKWKEK